MRSILRRVQQNKVIKNAGWLMAGKVMNMLLSLFVSLLTARYLGPGNYGLIHYAGAYTTFFASLCTLGLNSILVKEFVDYPEQEGAILGSALALRFISSLCSLAIIIGICLCVDRGEPTTVWVVALCNISLLFQVFDVFQYWFQYRLLSKFSAIASTVGYAVVSLYKLVLLMLDMSVVFFALSATIDYAIVSLFLWSAYKKNNGPKLCVSWSKAKEMLSRSYHFIFSGFMISIYNGTDRLMLKQMLSELSVGYYSVAVAICNMWVFVLGAIIDSMNPVIMQAYHTNKAKYQQLNQYLYAAVFYLSAGVSVVFTFGGAWLIELLYGNAYAPAAMPLRIITWYTAFSYLGVARNAWIVCENKQQYLKYLYFGAAVINVILNYLLIPQCGASGAAMASLITQISTIIMFPLFIKELRPNVLLMCQGVTFGWKKK